MLADLGGLLRSEVSLPNPELACSAAATIFCRYRGKELPPGKERPQLVASLGGRRSQNQKYCPMFAKKTQREKWLKNLPGRKGEAGTVNSFAVTAGVGGGAPLVKHACFQGTGFKLAR